MSNNEYKKRAKAGYNTGKHAKSQSNRDERLFEVHDISEGEVEGNPSTVTKKKAKKLNSLEKQIKNICSNFRYAIKTWKSKDNMVQEIKILNHKLRDSGSTFDQWSYNRINGYLSTWDRDIKFLEDHLDSDKVHNKYKKQIREILELVR